MAIRLRLVPSPRDVDEGRAPPVWVALCAAKTTPQEGDVYIDDGQDSALRRKFERDYLEMYSTMAAVVPEPTHTWVDVLMDVEEAASPANPARSKWDDEMARAEREAGPLMRPDRKVVEGRIVPEKVPQRAAEPVAEVIKATKGGSK